MNGSRREVEIKLAFDSPSSALEQMKQVGASNIQERTFEDNVLYERAGETLEDAQKMLRVRRFGTRTLVTFKGPVDGTSPHKVREEHETQLEDGTAFERILEELGFFPAYRYQKFRTLFELDDLHLCLDETPLGCFVELEGPPDSIDRTARRMGRGPDQYIVDSYRQLHEQAAAREGSELGDLVFERETGTSS